MKGEVRKSPRRQYLLSNSISSLKLKKENETKTTFLLILCSYWCGRGIAALRWRHSRVDRQRPRWRTDERNSSCRAWDVSTILDNSTIIELADIETINVWILILKQEAVCFHSQKVFFYPINGEIYVSFLHIFI